MKIAIMQPYFFPYVGYFQLINGVDKFVAYDDVNFIKGGWLNRNYIIGQSSKQRITLQLKGASSNKLINEVEIGTNRSRLLKSIKQNYSKAPFFHEVFPLISDCIAYQERSLSKYLIYSLNRLAEFFGFKTKIVPSSMVAKNSQLRGEDKILNICHELDANIYVNAIGGQGLYDRNRFANEGIDLKFLETGNIAYSQYNNEFIPNLSIIDVMMFNSSITIQNLFNKFRLI